MVEYTEMRERVASLLWSLDRFHSVNHIDSWCKANVWPGLPHLRPLLQGVNTSRCESVFAWLRGFAGALHTMSRWRCVYFVEQMVDMHNTRIASGDATHLGHHRGEDEP